MNPIPFIPETAPFTAHQRLWLNGYLAGLFAATTPEAAGREPAEPAPPLLVIFGSQTGTAEKIARHVAREAKSRGCQPRVVDAAAYATIEWKTEANLLVVTSTYGDGDMPDNAQAFWDWLQTDDARSLAHLSFSVLALGDTSYENFCAAGKKIDARLEQIGARRIHPRTDCDLDYDASVAAWTSAVLTLVGKVSGLSLESMPQADPPGALPRLSFDSQNPFPARLLANRRLNGPGLGKGNPPLRNCPRRLRPGLRSRRCSRRLSRKLPRARERPLEYSGLRRRGSRADPRRRTLPAQGAQDRLRGQQARD